MSMVNVDQQTLSPDPSSAFRERFGTSSIQAGKTFPT